MTEQDQILETMKLVNRLIDRVILLEKQVKELQRQNDPYENLKEIEWAK